MKVYKSSKVLILRPEIFSLTLGIFWAFFVFVLTLVAISSGQSSNLLEFVFPWYQTRLLRLPLGLIWGFVNGYLFGFLIGWIYSWLVKRKLEKEQKFTFELDFSREVNIIQNDDQNSNDPYTIVIVANPEIVNPAGDKTNPDPIISDKKLFYKVVVRIIRSFVNNEILRLPEIFNRIRIITIFARKRPNPTGDKYENALCKEYEPFPCTIMEARQVQMKDFVQDWLNKEEIPETIDIIFAITASKTHTRSSAWFTIDKSRNDANQGDVKFNIKTNKDNYTLFHEGYNEQPGVVALSVWDDRLKTVVHEFAHAMSSEENGTIVDEYLDEYEFDGAKIVSQFFVNKQHRENPAEGIPKYFARYKLFNDSKEKYEIEYYSDRDRFDKKPDDENPEGWTSYVPDRRNLNLSCTMDIAYSGYRFDNLIFDFMYDRLIAKINRS